MRRPFPAHELAEDAAGRAHGLFQLALTTVGVIEHLQRVFIDQSDNVVGGVVGAKECK